MVNIAKKLNRTNLRHMAEIIVLLMLILSSVALIVFKYGFILKDYYKIFDENGENYSEEILENAARPKSVTIRFSPDSVTVLTAQSAADEAAGACRASLRSAILENKMSQEDFETYSKISGLPAVVLTYDGISSDIVEKSLGLKNTEFSDIGAVEEIIFLLEDYKNKEIWVKSGNYYKLSKTASFDMDFVNSIKQTNYTAYYPILDFVTGKGSNVLIPLNPKFTLSECSIKPYTKQDRPQTVAAEIFGGRIDFTSYVRQKDSSVFYSYNNGEEVLSIDANQMLSYKNHISVRTEPSQHEAICEALAFLRKVTGGDTPYAVLKLTPHGKLRSWDGYTFYIARLHNNIPIIITDADKREYIKVTNGKVSEALIWLKDYELLDSQSQNRIISPINTLDMEIEKVLKVLDFKDARQVMEHIDDISLIYTADITKSKLIPAWKYEAGDNYFIIDAANGVMLSYGHI